MTLENLHPDFLIYEHSKQIRMASLAQQGVAEPEQLCFLLRHSGHTHVTSKFIELVHPIPRMLFATIVQKGETTNQPNHISNHQPNN